MLLCELACLRARAATSVWEYHESAHLFARESDVPTLAGLKLIGFAVWERRGGGGRNVTFPARQYSVNGERRSYALLRPVEDATAQERVRDLILQAYAELEASL